MGGGTPRRDNSAFFGGEIAWVRQTDVTTLDSMEIFETAESITRSGLDSSDAKLVPKGTVLLTSRATIGVTAVAGKELATNQGFANVICGDSLLPDFLYYWLPAQKLRMLRDAVGTIKEISKEKLKCLPIPVPSLIEQRRIVDLLRRADGVRRLRKQARDSRPVGSGAADRHSRRGATDSESDAVARDAEVSSVP